MGVISPQQASDGVTAVNAASINNPINTIAAEFNGNIDNANIKTAAAIATAKLASDNGIVAGMISSSAITLGYTAVTSNQTSTSATGAQLTGYSVTVTIPSGSRKIKITVYVGQVLNSLSSHNYGLQIWDGTVGSGTQLQAATIANDSGAGTVANVIMPVTLIAVVTPAAGSKTYNLGGFTSSGTLTAGASATQPGFILVEAV